MKKKAILGFMTGAAIVAATTGSYAAWDSLTAINKNASVEIKKPVTVTTSGDVLSPLETGDTASGDLVYEVDVPFTVAVDGNSNLKLTGTAEAKVGDQAVGTTTVEIQNTDAKTAVSGAVVDGKTYNAHVTVTLDDTDKTHAGETMQITTTATLEKISD